MRFPRCFDAVISGLDCTSPSKLAVALWCHSLQSWKNLAQGNCNTEKPLLWKWGRVVLGLTSVRSSDFAVSFGSRKCSIINVPVQQKAKRKKRRKKNRGAWKQREIKPSCHMHEDNQKFYAVLQQLGIFYHPLRHPCFATNVRRHQPSNDHIRWSF